MTATTAERQPALAATVYWRRNLAFCWVGVFVGLMGANFVFPFVPFYLKDLGVEGSGQLALWTGLSASATGLSMTITAPLWGALADRYGRKRMFMRALCGAGIVIGLMAFAQAAWHLVALRLAMGMFAGTFGAAAALIATTTPRERLGQSLGTLQAAQFSANMLGPVIGGLVAANLGIRESFVFCFGLYMLALFMVVFYVKEAPPAAAPEAITPAGKRSGGGIIANLRIVVAERQVVLMLGLLFMLWLSTSSVRPVMPVSVDTFSPGEDDGQRTELALPWTTLSLRPEFASGIVFGAVGLTSTIAALSVGRLGGRLGYRRCVSLAAALAAALFVTVSLANSFTTYILLMAAVGLFQGAMVPGTNALIAGSVPDGKQGSAFGLATSMQSMALLVGPLAGAGIAATLGIRAVYVSVGIVLLSGAVISRAFIREPRGLRRT